MAFVIERAQLRHINNFIFAFHHKVEMLIRRKVVEILV